MSEMCPAQEARLAADHAAFGRLQGRHPCFNLGEEGHQRAGRLHLPVSPSCNIQCRFCERKFNTWEKRPGVSRTLLDPTEAVGIVERALELCPAISVVGIAGPGDTLATDHALRTFELIHGRFPNLINCLSTNGLLLPKKAERLVAAGVQTVTVTVNAVDPAILAQLCAQIGYEGRRLQGVEAGKILAANQLAGIRRVTELGAIVKVNTVLVPGINDGHIGEIAEAVAAAGASLINIIPLIPQHELAHVPAPNFIQIFDARQAAGKHLRVFLHCKRCRADACGIPGESDFASELYDHRIDEMTFSHG
jgi:nitrogen fixation protein NifB